MIKLRFTPKEMNDPNKAFNIFQNKVISISKRKEEVDVKSTSNTEFIFVYTCDDCVI